MYRSKIRDIYWLVATKVIATDEEIFVDYNYDIEKATGDLWSWYREAKENQKDHDVKLKSYKEHQQLSQDLRTMERSTVQNLSDHLNTMFKCTKYYND